MSNRQHNPKIHLVRKPSPSDAEREAAIDALNTAADAEIAAEDPARYALDLLELVAIRDETQSLSNRRRLDVSIAERQAALQAIGWKPSPLFLTGYVSVMREVGRMLQG
jgi:hypothetical protein